MWNIGSEDLLLSEDHAEDSKGRFGWDESGKVFGINNDEVVESKKSRSVHCLRFRISNFGHQTTNALLRSQHLPSPIGILVRLEAELSHPSQVSVYCYSGKEGEEGQILQHSKYSMYSSATPDEDYDDALPPSPACTLIKCVNMKVGHILEVKLTAPLTSRVCITHASAVDVEVPLELAESYGNRPKFLEQKFFNEDIWISMQVDSLVRYMYSLARTIREVNGLVAAAHFLEAYQYKACNYCQDHSTIHLIDEYIEENELPPIKMCTAPDCGGGLVAGNYYLSAREDNHFKEAMKLRFDQYISPSFNWTRWKARDRKYARKQAQREYVEEVQRYEAFFHEKMHCPECKELEGFDSYLAKVQANEKITDPTKKVRSKCPKCDLYYVQSVAWNAEAWFARTAAFVRTKASKVAQLREQVALAKAQREAVRLPPMFKDTLGDQLDDLQGLLVQRLTEKGIQRILDPVDFHTQQQQRQERRKRRKKRAAMLAPAVAPVPLTPPPPRVEEGERGERGEGWRTTGSSSPTSSSQFFMTDSIATSAMNIKDKDEEEEGQRENALAVAVEEDAPTRLPPNALSEESADAQQLAHQGNGAVFLPSGLLGDSHVEASEKDRERPEGNAGDTVLDSSLVQFGSCTVSAFSQRIDEKKTSMLRWVSGSCALNPALIDEDSPLQGLVHHRRQVLVRVPCLHSSRHEVIKPWDPTELILLKPNNAAKGSSAPTSSSVARADDVRPSAHSSSAEPAQRMAGYQHVHAVSEEVSKHVSIRYFYTSMDPTSADLQPSLALPSIITDTYFLQRWSQCEYPVFSDEAILSSGWQWAAPVRHLQFRDQLSIPLGALFSVTLVPARDLDLQSVHFVSLASSSTTSGSASNRDFVFELVFPVQTIDHEVEDTIFGSFRVCLDKPVPFFDEFVDVNENVYVQAKHHKLFIDQLVQKMKRSRHCFVVTSDLAMIIGAVSAAASATFVVRNEIVHRELCELEFLCEVEV